jgi:multiple sugar transport system substrate-binding protein
MKRLLTTCLLALVLTLVVGAGSRDVAAGPASSGQTVTLRFPSWQWGQPGYDEFFTAAIAEFERAHPNVRFEKIPVASASYTDQIVKMLAANDPPEILQYLTQLFYKAAEADWLEPLDARLRETDVPKTWAPFLLAAGKVSGETYGVWISGSPIALMYNKRMLAEANVPVPRTPEALMAAAKALTRKGPDGNVAQFGYALTTKMDNNAHVYGLKNFVIGFGGNWGRDGKLDVMNPANRRAIEFERDLIKAGVVPLGADRIRAREIFWQGKAAMIIEGPWVMTSIKSENPKLLPDVGVAPMPFPNQTAGASNGFAIARGQKHKDLAWAFIRMVTSDAWMKRYGEMTAVTPARQNALTEKALKDAPWLTTFAEVQRTGKDYLIPGLESYQNEIDKTVMNRVADVFFGEKPVDDALAQITADLEKITRQ